MARTTVVVADDHPLVRQGLRALLGAQEDFTVVGEAADGRIAVDLVERLRPDVLLLDLMMPGLNGAEVARQVAQCSPKTRVVILSMHANEPYVLTALRNGVAGYILKDAHSDELVRGLREVVAGRRFLSGSLSERAIEAYAQKGQADPLDLYETLSTREREVLQLTAEDYSASDIATRLGISPRTVESHRAAFMRKLGLRNPTDLIRYALRRGILPME
jgi:two-component system, NarL family, response regulator NreC